jgi:transcriptional regulator with XRE-family HTH domain
MSNPSIKLISPENLTPSTLAEDNVVKPFPRTHAGIARNKVLSRKRKRSKHPLRELRIRSGYTLEDLAEVINMSPSYLSRLESGSRRLNADIMQRLSQALSCSPAELLPHTTFGTNATFGTPATSSTASNTNYPVDLPVYELKGVADNKGTLETTVTEQWIPRPVDFVGITNAFACIIRNSQWAPRYMDGDRLFLHPSAPLRPACAVLVTQKNGDTYIGRLKEMKNDVHHASIILENVYANKEEERTKTITISQAEIAASYRIMGTLESA